MESGSDSFPILDDFIDYFSAVRERSQKTMREYRYDLRLFFRYLKWDRQTRGKSSPDLDAIAINDIDIEFLKTVNLSEIYRFLSWLAKERGNGPAARARRVSSIRAFFKYLHNKVGLLDNNPAAELESPRPLKKQPRYLNVEESMKLLQTAANSEDKASERDYCILTLFLNCGLRLSELCGINCDDIRGELLTVLGKGGKERSIYLNSLCLQALEDYMKVRRPAPKPDDKALFISRERRRISQRAVENIVKKYILSSGLDPSRYSAHKLRHTAATLMYQHGHVDLRSLQQILGHQSVSTTEIYTHLDSAMLHRAVESNPLNQMRHELVREETNNDEIKDLGPAQTDKKHSPNLNPQD